MACPVDGARIAVLVQQLVLADVAGVVFSANPLTGSLDEIVVNASWGLGESVVGGSVTPDTYVVGAGSGPASASAAAWTIVQRGLAEKRRMTVAVAGGTREVDVPRLLWSRPSLGDEQVLEMAHLAHKLEQAMGWPVDLECAYRDDVLYLLQCRPITTLGAAARLEASAGNAARARLDRAGPRTTQQTTSDLFNPRRGRDPGRATGGSSTGGVRARPGPSAAPPTFPVVWEQPDDERRFWEQDRMHFPEPITMLDDALMRTVYGHGFNRAAEQYGLPVRGHTRRIGAYHYSSMAPNVPPEQMEAQGKIAEERINPAMTGLAELWEREWLPEIQQHIARLARLRPGQRVRPGADGPPRRHHGADGAALGDPLPAGLPDAAGAQPVRRFLP